MSFSLIAAKQSPPCSRMRSGKRGLNGGNLRSGRSSSTSCAQVGHAEEAARLGNDRGLRRPSLRLTSLHQAFGHVRLELQADDAAAPAALDRGAEIADQVLGFLLDLDVAVADDPEGAAAQHLIFREQIIGLAADEAFRARCSAPSPGMRMKRGRLAGAMISSRTLVRPFLSSKIRLRPLLGMNGKGCAGSIACGVRTGKICSRKCLSSHVSASASSGSSPTTCMPAASSAACSSAQTSCWLVTSRSASAVIAASCWARSVRRARVPRRPWAGAPSGPPPGP